MAPKQRNTQAIQAYDVVELKSEGQEPTQPPSLGMTTLPLLAVLRVHYLAIGRVLPAVPHNRILQTFSSEGHSVNYLNATTIKSPHAFCRSGVANS